MRNNKLIQVRVPEHIVNTLDTISVMTGTGRSELIRQAIIHSINLELKRINKYKNSSFYKNNINQY
tara:strand:- start:2275 stop:2472 length:198 start_codon:yes stop_codon:yes gene_type:complete